MRFGFPASPIKAASTIAGLVLLIVIQHSCTHEPFEPTVVTVKVPGPEVPGDTNTNDTNPQPPAPPTPATGCSEDTFYFQRDIDPLFFANCGSAGGCHSVDSAFGGLVLSSYDTVMISGSIVAADPMSSLIYQRITASDPNMRMPPPGAGSLNASEIHSVYRWIEDGAMDCEDCDTSDISYASTVRPLLNFYKCLDCHGGGAINLSDYSGVLEQANNGHLYGAIDHQPNFKPMPDGEPKMDSCHIAKIKAWIDAGAKDN